MLLYKHTTHIPKRVKIHIIIKRFLDNILCDIMLLTVPQNPFASHHSRL